MAANPGFAPEELIKPTSVPPWTVLLIMMVMMKMRRRRMMHIGSPFDGPPKMMMKIRRSRMKKRMVMVMLIISRMVKMKMFTCT